MAGMKLYRELKELEKRATDLGFRFCFSQYRFDTEHDVISLQPIEGRLPVYTRDAELFTGTHSEVRNFLRGIEWARKYDELIGAMPKNRRGQYEAKEVARLERIKYNKEKAETFKTLKKEHV